MLDFKDAARHPIGMSDTSPTPGKQERIAKVMARAGLCSRREAERWIDAGRVIVNGEKLTSPACVVGPADVVLVDSKPLPTRQESRLWRYHKPTGLVTSHRDNEGRQTVFDALPKTLPRVISVGRLDLTSEGLLLLTNDGDLARKLELPATAWTRRYRVRAHGRAKDEDLEALKKGIKIDGIRYGPIDAAFEKRTGANAWLTVSIKEGKNREVRKVMEHLGLTVNRLIRTAYGPFQLGYLKRSEVEEVKPKVLREQIGSYLT